jgi:hypothetical protein
MNPCLFALSGRMQIFSLDAASFPFLAKYISPLSVIGFAHPVPRMHILLSGIQVIILTLLGILYHKADILFAGMVL